MQKPNNSRSDDNIKMYVMKKHSRIWIGLNWLKLGGLRAVSCGYDYDLGFYKVRGIFELAEPLSASQEESVPCT
jgi:hypothetical protein